MTVAEIMAAVQAFLPDTCGSSKKITPKDIRDAIEVIAREGGAAGGAGGGSTSWPPVVTSELDMQGYRVLNVEDPRAGAVGNNDATNKEYVDQAIAAGALYQGIYTVTTNNPDLAQKSDVNCPAPVAGSRVNKPAGALNPLDDPANNVDVWFDLTLQGLHITTFPHTVTAPIPFEVRLSNQRIVKINIEAKQYVDWIVLFNEIHDKLVNDPDIANVHVWHTATDLWMGVETVAPLQALWMTDQVASPFPPVVAGPNNTILNTYNWVIQTQDENIPEPLPPCIVGIDAGTLVKNSDVLQWSNAKNGFEIISGSSLTQSFSDQRYWQTKGGNMAWSDQDYSKNAIVYSTVANAWFVATQNIQVGSPEPSSTQAGGMWRKINSTYGAAVFFGKGDYDASDTTASNNWGMPTNTYPSGQQPLNGDSYYDILTGASTNFTVTQNTPIYVITGTIDPANSSGDVGLHNIDIWPDLALTGTAPNAGQLWKLPALANQPVVIPSGVFANTVIPSNTDVYLVYSGDPDADNEGWAMVLNDASANWTDWSLNTPNAQNLADTIVASTEYGATRKFKYTAPATAAEGEVLVIIKGFQAVTQISRVEVRESKSGGSAFEFEVIITSGADPVLVPIAGVSHNPDFKEVGVKWDGSGKVYVVAGANIAGKSFDITISSQDQNVGALSLGTGTTTASVYSMNATKNFPNTEDVKNELIAQSASADIQVPQFFTRSSVIKDAVQTAFTLGVKPKRYLKGKFAGVLKADSNLKFIMNAGGWQNWALAGRETVVIENGAFNGNPNSWAADSSGIFCADQTKANTIITTDIEIQLFKEHTLIDLKTVHCLNTGAWTTVQVQWFAPQDSRNLISNIGYKADSGPQFQFVEAYIQWE